jgi:predicted NBD/HSP70 family sugar kinase
MIPLSIVQERITNPKAKEIYHLIRKHGTVSKVVLQEQSRITVSTLTRILEELVQQGFIVEVGYGESTGGRRPILYETNEDYSYVFGLEISRVSSKLVLCDMHLNVLESKQWVMDRLMTPDILFSQVKSAGHDMLNKRGLGTQHLLGMGIGAVGPLDRHQGIILDPLYFAAEGWKNVHIVEVMEQAFGIPVLLDNGANAALLGEYWTAREESNEHLLYIHAGVGIRSAMMTSGKLLYGAVDMEGAVGQMIIQTDGLPHREGGNYGCLETYVSIFAMEKSMQSYLKQGRSSRIADLGIKAEQVSLVHLISALKEGDSLTREVFIQTATYFGIGLANLLNILHPEKVILGGPLLSGNSLFFQVATETALNKTYYYPSYQINFSRGILGDEALVIGSAVMVINLLTE